ncbi:hypothetical protein GLYMA_14G164850v4 [Glycine max]|nr:hypothetical protein GLYMA_14G164850v4 [Glycine max]
MGDFVFCLCAFVFFFFCVDMDLKDFVTTKNCYRIFSFRTSRNQGITYILINLCRSGPSTVDTRRQRIRIVKDIFCWSF